MIVSVVTATCQRPKELQKAINSVALQSFWDLEHIIVSDGPDIRVNLHHHPPRRRVVELGRRSRDWGSTPRNVGTMLAQGDYIAYLDDDNEWEPNHLMSLLELIDESGADFVFSDALLDGEQRTIGNGKPEYTHIDTSCILHRRELLSVARWRSGLYENDWQLVSAWLAAGAKWAATGLVTVRYHQHRVGV